MKKGYIAAIVAAALTLGVAAGSKESLVITKPATPKHTIVKDFRAMFGLEKEMQKYILQKVKEGYVVKTIALMDDESWSKGIVVLEKY